LQGKYPVLAGFLLIHSGKTLRCGNFSIDIYQKSLIFKVWKFFQKFNEGIFQNCTKTKFGHGEMKKHDSGAQT